MAIENCKEVEDREAPLHGDILEAIFSHVPLIDLVPASHVSKSWKTAVFSSFHQSTTNNKLNPWLIVHKQKIYSPHHTTTHAYDPRSHVWIEITPPPSISHASVLCSSHSNLLYSLSPSKLSLSFSPIHLTWHHAAAPPATWRSDPVVAAVGRRVIVAGGGCDFEDDPLAVEIYDVESRTWDHRTCDSMPANLKDSSSSTWLSIATNNIKLFITEKQSGATHAFDPDTKNWSGPFDLRPDPSVFSSVIAFSNDRLILIGLIGDVDGLKGVKLWGINCDTFECEGLIGEMPLEFVAKLKRENFTGVSSIGVCVGGSIVYLYDPEGAEDIIVCELGAGRCRWGSVGCTVAIKRNRMERLVFTCSTVGIEDVERAMRWDKWRFRALRL